jgi:uncharacterized protein (DUF885 family)
MAIHVRTDYYWISTPKELEAKAFDLAFIAALAKKLKIEDIYDQAKEAYKELYNYWDKEGSAIAKKRTSINWLGGGSQYYSNSLSSFETNYMISEKVVELMTFEECTKELKSLLTKR